MDDLAINHLDEGRVGRRRQFLGSLSGAELRLDAAGIDRELAEMGTVVLGRTASRQVTGILVDFAKCLEVYLEHEPSLLTCSLKLAKTPCSPLYKTTVTPESATAALFAQACTGATEVP